MAGHDAGGIGLPAETAPVVALDELVLHRWNRARAARLPAGYDGLELRAVHDMVGQFSVDVADDALLLDRIVALEGRDPHGSRRADDLPPCRSCVVLGGMLAFTGRDSSGRRGGCRPSARAGSSGVPVRRRR